MFAKKPLRRFHVSTKKVYMPGKKTVLKRALLFIKPFTKRGVYRMPSGYILAL